MTTTKTIQKTLLLSLMSLALIVGCDKGGDEKKTAAKTDKGDKKGGDDVKAPDAKAPDPAPEPEPPAGPVFTSKNIIGEPVSSPIKPFDLGAMELPGLVIQAPEGTKAEPKSPSGFTLLDTRVNYSITVTEGAFDKAKAIETFGIVDPAGKIADESDTAVVYERSNNGGFLFQAGVTVGDKQYYCGSVATGVAFSREQIDQSVVSCKSITAAAGAAPTAPAGDAPAGDAPAPAGGAPAPQ